MIRPVNSLIPKNKTGTKPRPFKYALKRSAAAGAKWTTISSLVNIGLRFLQVVIVAQLLSPNDFGLMAITLLVVGLAQIYADMGISNAIIHKQDTTSEQLSSLYWLNVFSGACIYLVVVLATPFIATLYHEPELSKLLPLVSLAFVIYSIGGQFQILLQKHLEFRTIAIAEIDPCRRCIRDDDRSCPR